MISDSLKIPRGSRVVVMGIGSDFRGDDAAGVKVIGELENEINSSRVSLINAGSIPENFTSKISDFNPTHVILIDAVDFTGEPGDITLVNPEDITGGVTSTHRLPLSILINYIMKRNDAKVILLGIQPGQIEMNSKMTPEVDAGVRELSRVLIERLRMV